MIARTLESQSLFASPFTFCVSESEMSSPTSRTSPLPGGDQPWGLGGIEQPSFRRSSAAVLPHGGKENSPPPMGSGGGNRSYPLLVKQQPQAGAASGSRSSGSVLRVRQPNASDAIHEAKNHRTVTQSDEVEVNVVDYIHRDVPAVASEAMWAARLQTLEEENAVYREELDREFSARCRQLTEWMVAATRDGTLQAAPPAAVTLSLSERSSGLMAWEGEKLELQRRCADALLQREEEAERAREVLQGKDAVLQTLRQALERSEAATETKVREAQAAEADRWQRTLEEQKAAYESQLRLQAAQHADQLSQAAAALTLREREGEKKRERRMSLREEEWAASHRETVEGLQRTIDQLQSDLRSAQDGQAVARVEEEKKWISIVAELKERLTRAATAGATTVVHQQEAAVLSLFTEGKAKGSAQLEQQRVREVEEEASRRMSAAFEEARQYVQQREVTLRQSLSLREEALSEREAECHRRLVAMEAEAADRGRAQVEKESQKMRGDVERRYAALREAQEAWEARSAAWESNTLEAYATSFEKAKEKLAEREAVWMRCVLQLQSTRENTLLQERAALQQMCLEECEKRNRLHEAALRQEWQVLRVAEEKSVREREAALLQSVANARDGVVLSMEAISRDALQSHRQYIQDAYRSAEEVTKEHMGVLQKVLIDSAREWGEDRKLFEAALSRCTQDLLVEERQRVNTFISTQQEAYRCRLADLKAHWEQVSDDKWGKEALTSVQTAEREGWSTAFTSLQDGYQRQCEGFKAQIAASIQKLHDVQSTTLAAMEAEQQRQSQEVMETFDVQTLELQGMYQCKLKALEELQAGSLREITKRLESEEEKRLAQHSSLQERLEAVYEASLTALQEKFAAKEEEYVLSQQAERLLVEERLQATEGAMVAHYNDFVQQLSQSSALAVDEHRESLVKRQQNFSQQLQAIHQHLTEALASRMSLLETQELVVQEQQVDHLQTEMEHLELLLTERERREELERIVGVEAEGEPTHQEAATVISEGTPAAAGQAAISVAAPPAHAPQQPTMYDLMEEVQQLWHQYEIPPDDRERVQQQLRALAMMIPEQVGFRRQEDILQRELSWLRSCAPLLTSLERRQSMISHIASLTKNNGSDESYVSALTREIDVMSLRLSHAIEEQEASHGRHVMFHGKRAKEAILEFSSQKGKP